MHREGLERGPRETDAQGSVELQRIVREHARHVREKRAEKFGARGAGGIEHQLRPLRDQPERAGIERDEAVAGEGVVKPLLRDRREELLGERADEFLGIEAVAEKPDRVGRHDPEGGGRRRPHHRLGDLLPFEPLGEVSFLGEGADHRLQGSVDQLAHLLVVEQKLLVRGDRLESGLKHDGHETAADVLL